MIIQSVPNRPITLLPPPTHSDSRCGIIFGLHSFVFLTFVTLLVAVFIS